MKKTRCRLFTAYDKENPGRWVKGVQLKNGTIILLGSGIDKARKKK